MSIKFDFPHATKAQWLNKITRDLKGKVISELDWNITDDISISPFKDSEDLTQSYVPINGKSDNSWDIVEPIVITQDAALHNKTILTALDQGASALSLYMSDSVSKEYFDELLNGVFIDLIHVEVVVPNEKISIAVSQNYHDFLLNKKYAETNSRRSYTIVDDAIDLQINNRSLPHLEYTGVNGCQYYKGSQFIFEEMASILFSLHKRIESAAIAEKIDQKEDTEFNVSIFLDDTYLLNIAKIRALKKLYSRISEVYSLPSNCKLAIKGNISSKCMEQNVNINRIKASSIALSAVAGGIDRLELYNEGLKESDKTEEFNRRIARNINHILAMEGYLDKVVDPAAGSYYFEFLTDTLAKESWILFQNKWRETQ